MDHDDRQIDNDYLPADTQTTEEISVPTTAAFADATTDNVMMIKNDGDDEVDQQPPPNQNLLLFGNFEEAATHTNKNNLKRKNLLGMDVVCSATKKSKPSEDQNPTPIEQISLDKEDVRVDNIIWQECTGEQKYLVKL